MLSDLPGASSGAASPGAALARSRLGYLPPLPRIKPGRAWRWAWSRLWHNPVLVVVMPVWVAVGGAMLALVSPLAASRSGVGAVLHVAAAVLACLGSAMAGLTGLSHACLVIARGERARVRDLPVVPGGLRAWLMSCACGLVVALGMSAPVVGLVAHYFLVFATLIATDQRVCVLRAIRWSCSLARSGRGRHGVGTVWLMVLVLQVLGVVTLVGWVATVPVEVLMVAYAYQRLASARPPWGRPGRQRTRRVGGGRVGRVRTLPESPEEAAEGGR